jgi:hypothetical protein
MWGVAEKGDSGKAVDTRLVTLREALRINKEKEKVDPGSDCVTDTS